MSSSPFWTCSWSLISLISVVLQRGPSWAQSVELNHYLNIIVQLMQPQEAEDNKNPDLCYLLHFPWNLNCCWVNFLEIWMAGICISILHSVQLIQVQDLPTILGKCLLFLISVLSVEIVLSLNSVRQYELYLSILWYSRILRDTTFTSSFP